ncbi:hypothetical protein Cpir12675_004548 [Ceratocystis pirilliformis]|uniref:Uncharacterized protein n=1 Tax=Ceratocystis pirilliformis TaxID=259994 RepID=A0ABR3YVN4_9PEZI
MSSAPLYQRPSAGNETEVLHFDREVQPSRGSTTNIDRVALSDSMTTLNGSQNAGRTASPMSQLQEPVSISEVTRTPWRPGVFRAFPVWAILSIGISLCCTIVALCVVLNVNGQSVSKYGNSSLQPSVILAYTSTVANTALAFAMAEAGTVYYWTQALAGTQLVNLHYNWLACQGPLGGIKSLIKRRAIVPGLVCLAVGISTLLRGPLVQRVLDINSIIVPVSGSIEAPVGQTMLGYFGQRRSPIPAPSDNFTAVASQLQQRMPMAFANTTQPCTNCSMSAVDGFGFDIVCNQTLTPYNMTIYDSGKGTSNLTTLSVDFSTARLGNFSSVFMNVTRRPTIKPAGHLITDLCQLYLSRMSYKLNVNGRNVSFQAPSYRDDTVVERLQLESFDASYGSSGLSSYGKVTYGTTARSTFTFPYTTSDCTGPLCFTYHIGEKYVPLGQSNGNDPNWIIGDAFNSPTDDILNHFRELAFRLSLDYGTRMSIQQNLSYTSERSDVIYVINHMALVPAAIVSILGPLAILPLLLNWWDLGRETSMSPLELAVSFKTLTRNGIPLGDTSANIGGNSLAGLLNKGPAKDTHVQYGVAEDDILGMWEHGKESSLRRPIKGELL